MIVESEIERLLKKGVIEVIQPEPGEFISPIFLIPKSDGWIIIIPNLWMDH